MSKPPDEVDALLLQIRTTKWQAVTALSSATDGVSRKAAAALVATVDGIAAAVSRNPAPEALKAAKERLDALARLRDHEPLRRAAGRS